MKIFLWSLLALFLIGNALFVLPWHLSGDTVVTSYYTNYKKDSLLLHNIFPDGSIALKLNMPPGYEKMYESGAIKSGTTDSLVHEFFVNVSVFHNLDFTALAFPFYKVTSFNGVVPFYSIIKASNAPDRDSTALIGNIVVNGKVRITGICTPLYARTAVEKELVNIIKKELGKIETDINRKPPADSTLKMVVPEPVFIKPSKKKKR